MGKAIGKNPLANNTAISPDIRDPRTALPRDQIQDWNDPYRPEFHYPEGTVCSKCGAIYENQHWKLDQRKHDTLVAAGAANEVVCPGCRIIDSRDPQGILTLSGDYWSAHRDDVMNLIRNEEQRGLETNPLARIIDIREEGDTLVVETTNEKLAQRIGRAIHKAHQGDLEYRWPDGNNLVRLYWQRQLNGH